MLGGIDIFEFSRHDLEDEPPKKASGPAKEQLELRAWLRLLACTSLIEKTVRTKLREEFDTTLPRFDVLAQLDRQPDGLTMGELSRRLMVSHGNVTGVIDRLAEEGLVERRVVPEDRRTAIVSLTPKGVDLFNQMAPRHKAWVGEMFTAVPKEDLKQLTDLLASLKTALQSSGTP